MKIFQSAFVVYSDRFSIEEPGQQIKKVTGFSVYPSAFRFFRVQLRQRIGYPVGKYRRFPAHAFPVDLFRVGIGRRETAVMTDHEPDSALLDSLKNLITFLRMEYHGFLDKKVLTRPACLEYHFLVNFMGQSGHQQVYRRIFNYPVDVAGYAADLITFGFSN